MIALCTTALWYYHSVSGLTSSYSRGPGPDTARPHLALFALELYVMHFAIRSLQEQCHSHLRWTTRYSTRIREISSSRQVQKPADKAVKILRIGQIGKLMYAYYQVHVTGGYPDAAIVTWSTKTSASPSVVTVTTSAKVPAVRVGRRLCSVWLT